MIDKELKSKIVGIRLSKNEHERLTASASVHDMSISEFVRFLILNGLDESSDSMSRRDAEQAELLSKVDLMSKMLQVALGSVCMESVESSKDLVDLSRQSCEHANTATQVGKVLKTLIMSDRLKVE